MKTYRSSKKHLVTVYNTKPSAFGGWLCIYASDIYDNNTAFTVSSILNASFEPGASA
ncbi:MAG: hypothetical protein JWQ66_296 [Mucilaginibacter sp.]|nr:hypothetical protein [Mucilaginibacter sp.]